LARAVSNGPCSCDPSRRRRSTPRARRRRALPPARPGAAGTSSDTPSKRRRRPGRQVATQFLLRNALIRGRVLPGRQDCRRSRALQARASRPGGRERVPSFECVPRAFLRRQFTGQTSRSPPSST
jgi:hypothetical protein